MEGHLCRALLCRFCCTTHSPVVLADWFLQICLALEYCHDHNVMHRDLKLENLFVSSDGLIKLGDFGIAKILNDRCVIKVHVKFKHTDTQRTSAE